MPRSRILNASLAGLLFAGGIGGCMAFNSYQKSSGEDDAATDAAASFARSWERRQLEKAPYIGTSGQGAAENFRTATAALGTGPIQVRLGEVKRSGETATVNLNVRWQLTGGQQFSWVDPVTLTKAGGRWGVSLTDRSLWHPQLGPNGSFAIRDTTSQRGEVLGRGGTKIVSNQTVYDIAIDPSKASADTVAGVAQTTGENGVIARAAAAKAKGSKGTIPVITYRESDYDAKHTAFEGQVGVIVTPRTQPLAESRTFGQPLLGTVGRVTQEMVDKQPKKYRPGMVVGRSGLQLQYDSHLSPPSGLVVTPRGNPDKVLFGPNTSQAGKNLQTTLDPKVQHAAEQSLERAKDAGPAAVVAIDVPTGDVLALASSPSFGINRAATGRYQPGSTLKVATTYSLLTKTGLDPSQGVPCPPTVTVQGRVIRNFENETFDNPTFVTDFAKSCNSSFVIATKNLGPNDLRDAAGALGLGADWSKQIGVPAYAGSVPTTTSPVDLAETSFGQGRTLASPLSIAVMSGSVARGSLIPPALVVDPKADRRAKPLDAGAVGHLRSLMRSVVTEGTGDAVGSTPGGEVYAKTGTAEFAGKGGKPEIRAWFTGWQGDVAFAVLVEEAPYGKTGGQVAGPIANDFLTTLDAGQ